MAESDLALTFPPTEPQTDITTLIAAARKDPREFGALYQRFVNPVYRYLYNRTGNVHEAEDLTAQTFLIAYETFQRFRGDGHFAAWLFGIARNKVVDHYRQLKLDLPISSASHVPGINDPLASVVQAEQSVVLSKLILTLDEDEQELLRLRFLAEVPFRDIAHLLHRKEDAVKKTFYRLVNRLQKLMEDRNE